MFSWRDIALRAMANAIHGLPPEQWEAATDAADSKRGGNFGRGEGNPTLAGAAKLWRTPCATDWKFQLFGVEVDKR